MKKRREGKRKGTMGASQGRAQGRKLTPTAQREENISIHCYATITICIWLQSHTGWNIGRRFMFHKELRFPGNARWGFRSEMLILSSPLWERLPFFWKSVKTQCRYIIKRLLLQNTINCLHHSRMVGVKTVLNHATEKDGNAHTCRGREGKEQSTC